MHVLLMHGYSHLYLFPIISVGVLTGVRQSRVYLFDVLPFLLLSLSLYKNQYIKYCMHQMSGFLHSNPEKNVFVIIQ